MYVFYLLANAYVHLKLHMQWDLHLQIYVQTQRHLWCQPQRRMHGQNIADIGDCRTFRFAFCPHASYSRLGSRFFEGPQFPRKRLPTQTVASFISNSRPYILGSRFFVEPQILKKASKRLLQRCPERPVEAQRGPAWIECFAEAQRGAERP